MKWWIKLIKNEEMENIYKELFTGFRMYTLKAVAIYMINALFAFLGFTAINFYKELAVNSVVFQILGGIGIWLILMFLLIQIFVLPVLVMDEKLRIFTSYKKAVIMVMSIPFSSIFILTVISYLLIMFYPIFAFIFKPAVMPMLFALIALFPIFIMPFLSYNIIILMQINAAMLVYEKHNVMPDLKEVWEKRSLSHIFKPWDNK